MTPWSYGTTRKTQKHQKPAYTYDPEEVVHALVEESPDLATRKGAGYAQGYARLTVRNAFLAVFRKELDGVPSDSFQEPVS